MPDTPTEPEPVTVPSALARPLLRFLVRALTREVRDGGGGVIPPGIERFLTDLAAADTQAPDDGSSGSGTDPGEPPTMEVGTAAAAEVIGASREYVRRLCRTGRLPARRIGREWLITIDRRDHDGHDRIRAARPQ